MQSMTSLFGEIGASVSVDVLKYQNRRAILRVPEDYYVKLHSSLTLAGSYEGKRCAYRVHRVSPLLNTFCADSRTYEH